MILPTSVTRPMTEPVIVSWTTGTPSGAAPFLTTSEPSPGRLDDGERGRRRDERRTGSGNEGEAPLLTKYRPLSFPAIQGSVKVLLRAIPLPGAPRRPARARSLVPRRRGRGGGETSRAAASSASGDERIDAPFLGDGSLPDDGQPERGRLPRRRARPVSGGEPGAGRLDGDPDRHGEDRPRGECGERRPEAPAAAFEPGAHGARLASAPRHAAADVRPAADVGAAGRTACTASEHPGRARTRRSCACRASRRGSRSRATRRASRRRSPSRPMRRPLFPGVRIRRRCVPLGARPPHERAGDDRRRHASTGAHTATRPRRSSSCARATGRAASTSSASPPTTGASATRR